MRAGAALCLVGLLGLFAPPSLGPAQAQFFENLFGMRPPARVPNAPPSRRAPPQQQGGFSLPGFFGGGTPSRPYNDQWGGGPPRHAPAPTGDFSRAPPPKKPEVEPTMHVVVLGDSMADWLAYGLEDAFAESSELGVTRKHRTHSGLIKNDAKDYDWVQATKDALAQDRADFVVVMLGLGDRKPIRERLAAPKKQTDQAKAGEKNSEAAKSGAPAKPGDTAKPGDAAKAGEAAKAADPEKPADAAKADDAEADKPEVAANEPAVPAKEPAKESERPTGPLVSHEFRSERWAELYAKRIDEVIAAAKAKRVPLLWVGLPPIRGARARADVSYLNDLYRARAEKAGILYVDVWEGFVDEDGEYTNYGPDVIGQVRRLRAGDGVHFTKAGARKLAHYVDREVKRLLSKATPVALPIPEEPQPATPAAPGAPARPVAGPVVPLTGVPPSAEVLIDTRGRPRDDGENVATKVLVKGEPLQAPSGRADNFAWQAPAPDSLDATIAPDPEPVAARPVRPATRPSAPPRQRQGQQSAPQRPVVR